MEKSTWFRVMACLLLISIAKSFPREKFRRCGIHGNLSYMNQSLRTPVDSSYRRHDCSHLNSNQDSAIEETLAPGLHMAEIEVKKSKFIAYAASVDSWEAASVYIDQLRSTDHPKARHWCYGFCLATSNERCSDDGEPSGTAGAPILQAIHGQGVVDTVCIVVRYFGGIKLGAGGLIRAYGGAARAVLREAPRERRIPQATVSLRVEAAQIGTVYEQSSKVQGTASNESYGDDGSLCVTITCEATKMEGLKEKLRDSTRGKVEFTSAV